MKKEKPNLLGKELTSSQMARGEKSGTSPLQGEGLGATPSESIKEKMKKENDN